MRITFVTPSLHTENDERCALGLLSRLSTDHSITVVTGEAPYPAPPRNIRVTVLPSLRRPFPALLRYLSFLLSSSIYLMEKRRLYHRRKEIIHATGGDCFFANVVTSNFCQAERLALATAGEIEVESKGEWKRLEIWSQKMYMRVVAAIERIMYGGKSPDVVIAVSEGLRRDLQRHYGRSPERTVVIANAVDLDRFHPAKKRNIGGKLRKELGYEPDDFVLLFLGGDWGRKGLRCALEALAFVVDTPVKLLVVGRGDKGKYVRLSQSLGVAERVHFAGFRNDVEAFYAAADCFVAPSVYEACSIALLEAAATGLPLLCTRINGAEEMLEDGVNGFFVERSGQDIARKVRTLALDRDLVVAMGHAARHRAESDYNWERLVERTLEVYAGVVSGCDQSGGAEIRMAMNQK